MLETWELLSYIVTVIGLPLAILVYLFEQHKERRNDENDVYERLSRNYQDFLQLALDNPDLQLLSQKPTPNLGPEQEERMQEWCTRDDSRNSLPGHIRGEDPEFADYIKDLAKKATG